MDDRARYSDAELLRRSRRDPDAFVEVCRRHSHSIGAYLRGQTHDDGLAKELLAETLSEAWFSRARFRDAGDGSAQPWLFGIAKNLVRRLQRTRAIETRARARLGLPVAHRDEIADVLDRVSADQRLGSAAEQLSDLPPEQREALELRIVHDLDYAEIGERLALTPEGARTRVFRALGSLRTHFERSTS
jgi:RNA polymerase sigma-70 factor (ECF subfamily)